MTRITLPSEALCAAARCVCPDDVVKVAAAVPVLDYAAPVRTISPAARWHAPPGRSSRSGTPSVSSHTAACAVRLISRPQLGCASDRYCLDRSHRSSDSGSRVAGARRRTQHPRSRDRSRARAPGRDVHCLSDRDPPQPTAHTRYAKVHFRRGLNSGPSRVPRELLPRSARRTRSCCFRPATGSQRYCERLARAERSLPASAGRIAVASCSNCSARTVSRSIARGRRDAIHARACCAPRGLRRQSPQLCRSAGRQAGATLSSFKAIRIASCAHLRQLVEPLSERSALRRAGMDRRPRTFAVFVHDLSRSRQAAVPVHQPQDRGVSRPGSAREQSSRRSKTARRKSSPHASCARSI